MRNQNHLQKQYVRRGLESQIRNDFGVRDLLIETPTVAEEKEEIFTEPLKLDIVEIPIEVKKPVKKRKKRVKKEKK